ncbi:DUF4190 domain-containing protein [Arthrobacter sp. NPDC090010]|uniref:DUF4190 domain-containing protein n=1 Tax=Arthrobacter sp. NPDC090010 TaxID=3363942 RepID=UPI003803A3E3
MSQTPQYQAPQSQPYAPQKSGTNTLAIISLISAFFISLLGVILGFVALSQIKRTGEGGRGLAIAGIIVGFAGMVIGLIVAISTISMSASLSNY